MIRTLIASAALTAGLVGQAGAVATVLVDNFEEFDQFVWTHPEDYPTTETSAAMVNGLTRTVTHAYAGPLGAAETHFLSTGPNFDSGHLSVSNGTFASTGTVSWALTAPFLSGISAGVTALKFDVVESDALLVTATLKLNAMTLGSQSFGAPGVVSFALGASQSSSIAAGGMLSLVFTGPLTGPVAYDMTIDNVRFEVSPVPETSTALMMLAGLLAAASLRRRLALASERA